MQTELQAARDEPPTVHDVEIADLATKLGEIRAGMANVTDGHRERLKLVDAQHRESAENLIDYLALRRHDLRALQPRLSALGLSSLGRAEGSVRASVDAVLRALRALSSDPRGSPCRTDIMNGAETLERNTNALLGPAPAERRVRIMVTMPSEAAHDYSLVHELVNAGMDCMRINCAHDDARVWARMIEHLERANQSLGRHCLVAMDLGGPKLRTGPLEPGPAVIKIRPERDVFGRTVRRDVAERGLVQPAIARVDPVQDVDDRLDRLPQLTLRHLTFENGEQGDLCRHAVR